ncbi:MAG: hypothetical protein A2Y96_01390 [Firmicutes bacterium RBG_13_65_8]|nr:MAG: hypothetical protein A2Y96_01390 [Firmicutes bacterium RBG_13_65_8]
MNEERDRGSRPADAQKPAEEEWVDESQPAEEWAEEHAQDAGAATGGWVEGEERPVEKEKPKKAPAYYTWLFGLLGLLIGLSMRSCR